jgi:hypothetical protein
MQVNRAAAEGVFEQASARGMHPFKRGLLLSRLPGGLWQTCRQTVVAPCVCLPTACAAARPPALLPHSCVDPVAAQMPNRQQQPRTHADPCGPDCAAAAL